MKPFHVLIPGLLVIAIFGQIPLQAKVSGRSGNSQLPGPSADWQPEEVVRIIIDALANNDKPYPDAGIDTTFRFASPANRAHNGPIDEFARMVRSEPYGLMVDHASSDFSKLVYLEGNAFQMVNLITADGRGIVYAFQLSKQQGGEFDGMWMNDAVWAVARHGKGATPLEPTARAE